MDKSRTMLVVLLCVIPDMLTEGVAMDVCATCHANARCDDKLDGSGKVCNCKYGFVGNGRTFCQDKDECQIEATKICGQHTTCHNTHGSFYCTCLGGYSPSNKLPVFIPNDGTHCQDINECTVSGLCGDGGRCRNLEGGFECSCKPGFRIHNGEEPFHPRRDKASCKVVDCGPPASGEGRELLSVTGTTYGSVATFACTEDFVWRSGDNISECGAEGVWRRATMVCEEVDCGVPPALPHAHNLRSESRRRGAEVFYECDHGYHNVGGGSRSVCSDTGRWEGASVICRETFCGSPPAIESTEQVWDRLSIPGGTVLYFCKVGFFGNGGQHVSICSESGQWSPPTLTCQEVSCGVPPTLPDTVQVWNGSSTRGSTATYGCRTGFYHNQGTEVSMCTTDGYWTKPNITCKEVDCGEPPPVPHSVMLWRNVSTVGSRVVYRCHYGYQSVGERNQSVCTPTGEWEAAPLLCREITCQEPLFKPHAKMLWDGASHIGSVVYYQCEEAFHARSLRNYSVCGEDGLWEESDLWCEEVSCGVPPTLPDTVQVWNGSSTRGSTATYGCRTGFYHNQGTEVSMCTTDGYWTKPNITCEEISCGPPLNPPHTNLLWDGSSEPGSVVMFECVAGFHQESGNNISTCLLSGEWGGTSMKCKAKCGRLPFLANSEVMWSNGSVVIQRCVDGYHSWRGSSVSECGVSGRWSEATLRCIERKPPVSRLIVLNEKCLRWKAEKYEEDTEEYKVTYTGSRDFQRSFQHKRKRFVSSKADQLELCLNLLPFTNYSVSVTAVSARFTATVTTNTTLPAPPAPAVYYREFDTPVPTLRLHRSPDSLDPISLYQVYVLPLEGIMTFDCYSPATSDPSSKAKSSAEYITAQVDVRHVGTEMNFTVGDGLFYGGFHNAPLEKGRDYYIILRAVSQWKTVFESSCVLWAKIRGTSYILKVSSLTAIATIGALALVILCGYSFTWFLTKT